MIIKSAILCLALNVYFEARGEPIQGQYAVAHVTLNRVQENNSDVCTEVFKPNQFSWTKHTYKIPSKKDKSWLLSQEVAHKAISMKDTTGGALFFHSKNCRKIPSITRNKIPTRKIGDHIFYANR